MEEVKWGWKREKMEKCTCTVLECETHPAKLTYIYLIVSIKPPQVEPVSRNQIHSGALGAPTSLVKPSHVPSAKRERRL